MSEVPVYLEAEGAPAREVEQLELLLPHGVQRVPPHRRLQRLFII